MKEKVHYVIEAVLAVAVIILFVLQFSNNRKLTPAAVASGNSAVESPMPIAFIDVDSLISNYTYSIDLNEQITKKYENSRANLTEKFRKLQSEAVDFQRKVDTGSFLSRERLEAEQQRLMKKEQELQELQAQTSQELGEEQLRINEALRETIISQLREFNKAKGYQVIYGKKNDNILFADNVYDITGEVIEYLNRLYTSPSSAKE